MYDAMKQFLRSNKHLVIHRSCPDDNGDKPMVAKQPVKGDQEESKRKHRLLDALSENQDPTPSFKQVKGISVHKERSHNFSEQMDHGMQLIQEEEEQMREEDIESDCYNQISFREEITDKRVIGENISASQKEQVPNLFLSLIHI